MYLLVPLLAGAFAPFVIPKREPGWTMLFTPIAYAAFLAVVLYDSSAIFGGVFEALRSGSVYTAAFALSFVFSTYVASALEVAEHEALSKDFSRHG